MKTLPFKVPAFYFPIAYAAILFCGLFMCLLLTVRMHYKSVVTTHCKNWEFWPSISATTGDYMPERAIWRVAVAMCSGPRIVTSFLLYAFFTAQAGGISTPTMSFSLLFDVIRILCAMGWAFVTSSENHDFHIFAFALYIICGFIYQSTQAALCRRYSSRLSYRIKQTLLFAQVSFAIGVGYFYYDHQMTCLPGRYSRATVCEWLFSISNILYDASQFLDVQQMSMHMTPVIESSVGSATEVPSPSQNVHLGIVLISETVLSTIYFSATLQFWQNIYFVPMVAMEFTQETAVLIAPFACCAFASFKLRAWAQSPKGQWILSLSSLVALLSVDTPLWTSMRLLISGFGYTIGMFALFARLLRRGDATPLTMAGVFLGLVLSNVGRLTSYGQDPIFTGHLINAFTILLGLIAARVVSTDNGIEEDLGDAQDVASTKGTLREGVALGAFIFWVSWLFTEYGVLARWVGVEPFPSGIFMIAALLLGFATHIHSPSLISSQVHAMGLLLGSAVLFYGSRNTILMEGDPWEGQSITTYGYYGYPTVSYLAGLVVAFITTNAGPRFVESVVRPRPFLGRIMFMMYLTKLTFLLVNVYTVTFPFVPGGSFFRNRMNIAVFPLAILLATFPCRNVPVPKPHIRKLILNGTKTLFVVLLVVGLSRGALEFIKSSDLETKSAEVPKDHLKVAIWTIHYGMDDYGRDSLPRLLEMIERTKAPIVGLLETDLSRPQNGNRDVVEYAANYLNMYSDFGPSTLDNTFGCALLTRYKIERVDRYIAPSPMGELACHIHAWLHVGTKVLQVHVAHFGNTDHWKDRLLHGNFLATLAINNPGPTIFLGYLTTKPGSDNYKLIVNSTTGLQDTGDIIRNVPFTFVKELQSRLPNGCCWINQVTGRNSTVDPATHYEKRYCQYILFRGLELADFEKISAAEPMSGDVSLSDTEMQVGTFDPAVFQRRG